VFLILIGTITAVVLTFGAPQLIQTVYGTEYQPSVLAFQILTWAILLSYVNALMNTTLTAMNRVKLILYTLMTAIVIKTIINLVLVHQIGIYSGSIANVVGELFVTIVMLTAIESYRHVNKAVLPKVSSGSETV
jgi:O-antigen/teichoic acid export membrane protein